jgi:hypothetical protein
VLERDPPVPFATIFGVLAGLAIVLVGAALWFTGVFRSGS